VNSAVERIITFLESVIATVGPTLSPSKHYYDFELNPSTRDDRIFAVRPGRASSIEGTTKSVTINQEFEIELARDFFGSEANDLELRKAINAIYYDNEKIMKELSMSRSEDILNILPPSFDAPKINENGRSVSVVFNYPIIYRKSVKGVY
jgi:hypothetical protein